MRIRDWSSDVCSSDLRDYNLDAFLARKRRRKQRPGFVNPLVGKAGHGPRQPHQFVEGEFGTFMTLPARPSFRKHFAGSVDYDLIEHRVLEERIEWEQQLADDAGIRVFRHPHPASSPHPTEDRSRP